LVRETLRSFTSVAEVREGRLRKEDQPRLQLTDLRRSKKIPRTETTPRFRSGREKRNPEPLGKKAFMMFKGVPHQVGRFKTEGGMCRRSEGNTNNRRPETAT